ncbi:MAG: TRZ/ATZ family hydrolase [Pseudohongiellaceae bacterium]
MSASHSQAQPAAEALVASTLIQPRWLVAGGAPGVMSSSAPGVASGVAQASSGQLLSEHTVALADRHIVAVLPNAEAEARFPQADRVRLEQHLLIPGLVNAHGHSAMSLMRGIADDIPLKAWLEQHIWPLEAQFVSEEFVQAGAMLACAEMIRSGTTCFADMYFFPEQVAKVVGKVGIRAQLASPVLDFTTAWAQDANDYISKATRLRDEFRGHPLVTVAFGPHAPYTVSDEPLKKIAMLAAEMELPIHIHLHETAGEVADAVAQNGCRPLERLHKLGLVTPQLVCVHATQLTMGEIELLGKCGANVVHCPQSNLKLASGFCELAKLLAQPVNVALGTDGCASNNDLDMLGEMQMAALLGKGVAGDASVVTAQQTLAMATINGARALGLDEFIGSIEPGKYADLTAINLHHLNTLPVYDPVSALVYSARANQVSHVWCDGRLLLKDGELQTIDEARVRATAQQWQQQIQAADMSGRK